LIKYFFLSFVCLFCHKTLAQSPFLYIGKIKIEGLKHTNQSIVYRNISFSVGDSIRIDTVDALLSSNSYLLMNTELFSSVKIIVSNKTLDNQIEIQINVLEAWYLYPIPIFELADRNFNVWVKEQNLSLSRINFGVNLSHLNLQGIQDPLNITFQIGYTQKFAIEYAVPYVNKAKTIGLNGGIFYSDNKEIAYKTLNNVLQFRKNNDAVLLKRIRGHFGVNYTPGLNTKHLFSVFYYDNRIDPYVSDSLNSEYFSNNSNKQKFFTFNYTFSYDRRDIRPFPKNGYLVRTELKKDGLLNSDDRNTLDISLEINKYIPMGNKIYWEFIAKSKYSILRNLQDYRNYRGLGYQLDYIRGYELYVMDGLDYSYAKSSFRYELFDKIFNVSKILPINAFRKMSLKSYFTANTDIGYVNDPFYSSSNPLNNKMLLGYGVGINFVLYYNVVFGLEYSINDLSQKGLYLHFNVVY
jgi:outer membrane protein assembly factor BamA